MTRAFSAIAVSCVLALAAFTAHAQVPGVPMRLWLFWGQSTITGADAPGPNVSANAYGNKRMAGYNWWPSTVLYLPQPEDLTDANSCEPRSAPYDCLPFPGSSNYGGPWRHALDQMSAFDGNTRTAGIAANSGINFAGYFGDGETFDNILRIAIMNYSAATNGQGMLEGVVMMQGESDYATAKNTYKTYLTDLRTRLETRAQTFLPANRGRTLVMYLNQFSSCGLLGGGYACSSVGSMQAMTELFQEQPDKFRMVGPTYAYPHAAMQPHMTVSGNKRRGAKNGEVFVWDQTHENKWLPLYATNAESLPAYQVYRVTYSIPYPPLVNSCPGQITDTDPTYKGGWLTYEEQPAATYTHIHTTSWSICTGSGVPHAACQNASQVIIVPASWAGSVVSRVLYYATVPLLTTPGPTTGQRGCVADSDPFVADGIATPNNAIHQNWYFAGG